MNQWLATAKPSRFKRPYTELVYQPMLEVMDYLRANGFKTYIVSGGGQEFVRAYSKQLYGIPPEQVVGSSVLTKYVNTRTASQCCYESRKCSSSTMAPANPSASTCSSASGQMQRLAILERLSDISRWGSGSKPATVRG